MAQQRKPNETSIPESVGYRGDPGSLVVHKTGEGVGSTIKTADGTEYEVVWAGGEGLTADHGSGMYALLNGLESLDDEPEAKRMRHEKAKKARHTQLVAKAAMALLLVYRQDHTNEEGKMCELYQDIDGRGFDTRCENCRAADDLLDALTDFPQQTRATQGP